MTWWIICRALLLAAAIWAMKCPCWYIAFWNILCGMRWCSATARKNRSPCFVRQAAELFAEKFLRLDQPFDAFVRELQARLREFKIGVLRMEDVNEATGRMILTLSEDADCSGLPVLGETVCNYDEGFIAGILSAYTGKPYTAVEIDCWATGDRVCRFRAEAGQEHFQ